MQSPWEEAVANSQRDPLVTVPVERRELAADVTEAQGRFSAGQELNVPAPALDVPGVVTNRTVAGGDRVQSGSVLAEVSGRPIVGLVTPFRLYRNIVPGDVGPDVRALQDALRDLDLYVGESDGEYGVNTASAVKALYARLGYTAPIDQALVDAVEDAEKALAEATRVRQTAVSLDGPHVEGDPASSAGADAPGDLDRAVAEAQLDLVEAQFAALTQVRASEITRLPGFSATVISAADVGAEVGGGSAEGENQGVSSVPGNSLVRLRVGDPSATVRVGLASKDAFQEGAQVEVRAVANQRVSVTATVGAVSEFRQPDGDTPGGLPGYDVTLEFEESPPFSDGDTVTAASLEDAGVKADGLAVPLIALREDTTGTFVKVVGRGRAAVTVVATGDGYAVVETDELSTDDDVIVSGDQPESGRN